ncbi:MAG: methyltransferase domain-containing protein [Actinobacteria bacterium]|nr:methyltransferase domain-containing protein [Actinomycetota bacterium]MCA1719786.1 methyltransferase domain-containing protein [Actinomycetota bacterium]
MTDATWVDAMPQMYDSRLGPALFAPYAQELAARAAALRPRRVLEVAAGTGIVTRALQVALPDAELLATDLNPPMVAWAAQHVPEARWEQADAQDLRYDPSSFDLVVCSFGVMFFPDRVAALAQMARVLTPDGAALLSVWDSVDTQPFAAALMDSLTAVLPEETPDFVVRTPHGYADPARIAADLEAAGFGNVDIQRVVLSGRSASARALAEGFCLGTPLRFALEQRGLLADLTARVAGEMTARLGTGPVDGDLPAYVVTARSRPA